VGQYRVAIVGAGFSGTLTAVQILRQATRPVEIILIDTQAEAGRGVAYGTNCPHHLLNVSARRMSALPDKPTHFLDWAACRDPRLGALDFAPRSMYGEYVAEVLSTAELSARSGVRLRRIRDRATGLDVADEVLIRFAACGPMTARHCVLALGNFAPGTVAAATPALRHDRRYVASPWTSDIAAGDADATVVLIGTGLTAVDMVAQLDASGHRGPFVAVSRHGLLPTVHTDVGAPGIDIGLRAGASVRDAVRRVRVASRTHSWRQVVDGLRAETPALWQAWGESDRRRFLRHVRAYWDVHRHRIAPQVGTAVAGMLRDGRLEIIAGTLTHFRPTADYIEIGVRRRGCGDLRSIRAGLILNCTGPTCDYRQLDDPLVRCLLERGLAATDPLHLGLVSNADGAIVGANGRPSPRLFTLGPPSRPHAWETTAVPEICVQAEALARRLLDDAPT